MPDLCPIGGDAYAIVKDEQPVWERADPTIHVTNDVLDLDPEDDARKFIEAKYEIGEACPYDSRVHHARLREVPDAE